MGKRTLEGGSHVRTLHAGNPFHSPSSSYWTLRLYVLLRNHATVSVNARSFPNLTASILKSPLEANPCVQPG
jgi:hypothetical protein